jgi:hypothetical protein
MAGGSVAVMAEVEAAVIVVGGSGVGGSAVAGAAAGMIGRRFATNSGLRLEPKNVVRRKPTIILRSLRRPRKIRSNWNASNWKRPKASRHRKPAVSQDRDNTSGRSLANRGMVDVADAGAAAEEAGATKHGHRQRPERRKLRRRKNRHRKNCRRENPHCQVSRAMRSRIVPTITPKKARASNITPNTPIANQLRTESRTAMQTNRPMFGLAAGGAAVGAVEARGPEKPVATNGRELHGPKDPTSQPPRELRTMIWTMMKFAATTLRRPTARRKPTTICNPRRPRRATYQTGVRSWG